MHATHIVRRPWLALCFALGLGAALPAIAAEPAPDGHTARFEINFMEDMIDHHTMAPSEPTALVTTFLPQPYLLPEQEPVPSRCTGGQGTSP